MDQMKKKLHVLIIEDSQADAELNISMLQSAGYDITWQRVETAEEMIKAVDLTHWDLVLSDYSMPEFNVEEALKIHLNHGRDIPFIVVSGTIGEEKVVQLIKAGVHNYMHKNSMARFIPVVERELSEANIRRELILTHSALVVSEEKYRSYIEHDPDGVFVADENGKYIEVNEAACRITGYSKEELLTMSVLDLLSERSVDDGLAHFRKVLETGSAKADLVFRQKNGTKRWWSLEAVKLSKTKFLGFAKDITIRIEMENSLSEFQRELVNQNQELNVAKSEVQVSADRYTELFNFAPSGLFLLSEDYIITEVNHSGASLLGRKSTDLIGCHFGFFISQDTLPYFIGFLSNVFKSKTKEVCEVVLSSGSDQTTFVHIEGIVVGDNKQCLLNVIDINERKQSVLLLQQTRQNYEIFFNTIDDFLFVLDLNGNIIHANSTVNSRLGYDSDEFIGKSVLMFHPPNRRDEAQKIINEMICGVTEYCPVPLITKTEGQIDVETRVSLGSWDGKPVIFGVSKDVTKLKLSEEKFSKLFYLSPSACGLTDLDTGKYTEINEAFTVLLGFEKEEVIGKTPLELGILNDESMSSLRRKIHPEKRESNLETTLNAKDGSMRHVLLSAEKIHVQDKSYRFTVVYDLTKRKLAEEKLRESEMRFRAVTESANDAIISSNSRGIIIGWNKGAETMFGYKEEEIAGKNLQVIMPEKYGLKHNENIERILKGEESHMLGKTIELAGLHKNGTEFPIEISVANWESASNKFFTGIIRDITQRKKSEKLLADSEATLVMAQRIAHIGSWEWDLVSNSVMWSKEMFNILGIDPATYDGRPESLIDVLHPDDVESFTQSMNNNLTQQFSSSLEYRVIHKDGSVHYVYAEGWKEFDDAGNPARIIGTVQDVTLRKKNESELIRANTFLDSIIQNIPDMIFIKDANNLCFVQINRAGEELLGISKEELLGKSDFDFFPQEQAESFIAKDREVIAKKVMGEIHEEQIQTKYKGLRTLHTYKVPLFNTLGEPEYLLGISEDITELNAAKQAMRVSEEKYKTMLNASPDGILLIDMNGIITETSEIGMEIFGAATRADLVGKSAMRFVPSQEKNTLRDLYEKTISEGLAQNIEINIRKKNHTLFPAEISTTLIQEPGGKPLSFMIIVRDISQRKKTETKQFHADRMANLGEMASGIAHEINQPLNIISMVMDKILFESAKTNSVDVGFLATKSEKIFSNITRIRNIIDHVRAFSRSHDDYVLSAFDINASIENAVSMISEQFKHLGIILDLQLEGQLPSIVGNTYKFEQVIINLLVNAKDAVIERKIMQPETEELVVGIRSYQENQVLTVEVTDNGIGIRSEDANYIMLPFYTTKDEGKGTGLGLSICYQIIKGMNGAIEIESSKVTGTKIKIVLNLQKNIVHGSKRQN